MARDLVVVPLTVDPAFEWARGGGCLELEQVRRLGYMLVGGEQLHLLDLPVELVSDFRQGQLFSILESRPRL